MIHIPPQHNTQHPAGQIVNPVGVVSPTKQIKDLASEISDFHLSQPMRAMEKHKEAYRKAADECCHKTVLQQCVDCPHKGLK